MHKNGFGEVSASWDGRGKVFKVPFVGKVEGKSLGLTATAAAFVVGILAMSSLSKGGQQNSSTLGQPDTIPMTTGALEDGTSTDEEDLLIADLDEPVES